MDNKKYSPRSKSLTVRDYEALAVTFGFGDNVDAFIDFVQAQQYRADHPVERIIASPTMDVRQKRTAGKSMVYGSGRA
jgi:hypothetical protein